MEFQEGMDLDLGSSGIDGVDSVSFGMNVMSGYPSKKLKTGEEQVNFDKMPLLSCICKMDYLLRTFGEKVKFDQETVSGKYILFYCFFHQPVPVRVVDMYYPMDLFNLCTDLYSVRDNFEMVFVPKPGEEDKYDLGLQGFFSIVPTYSLVVPTKESHRRNFMCDCLGLVYPGTFKCLLVNVKKGIVVHGGFDSMLHLAEHLQKLQKESSFDCLRSYERIFKTLWLVIPKEQKNPFPPIQACPIANKLMGVKLEYGLWRSYQ
ncbi:hypothetical protein DM860_006753 [Cuscuta australis]|uniref:Uncharacterized protein n=1 Tax=Cuscuta australis TaxID=267555 RepID=A0A328D9R8_9ASTE|nr:hypothetical protein DM860_006753 [Cuscuta australis]